MSKTDNPLLRHLDPNYVSAKKNPEFDFSAFFRILANENLTIIEGPFKTASADIEARVLRIPDYSKESKALRILFGCHEVGHFLFTPKSLWHEVVKTKKEFPKGLFSCVNIIEDVRIEKKIRQKFPGIIPEFKKAYKELMDRKFFGNISERSGYINKFNVKSKVGEFAGFEFDGKDLAVYKYLLNTHDIDEVIKKAKFLYIYAKESDEARNAQDDPSDEDGESGEDGEGENGETTFADDIEIEIVDEEESDDGESNQKNQSGKIDKIKVNINKNAKKSSGPAQMIPQHVIDKINQMVENLPDSYFESELGDSDSDKILETNMQSKIDMTATTPKISAKFSRKMEKVAKFIITPVMSN